jgi:predicted negative regulator of RcsB-dependent stress response
MGWALRLQKKVNVSPGCQVDVILKSRIANLGLISYAFEVHNKGSMDSAILNLQKVLHKDSSIQKIVLVSNEKI